MTHPTSDPSNLPPEELDDTGPVCIMVFNASDPSGAAGLAADISTIASIGGHALPIVTGAYIRDSAKIFDHVALDEDAVNEQARAVLEDIPVQVFKVGFVGSPENISSIAEIASDYADTPLVAYMPDLSWWDEDKIDQYQDAFRELMLPQTSLLVGNYSTLWRWLLPQWSNQRSPSPRDLAKAAAELGVSYTLVTSIPLPEQFIDNVLASPQTVLASAKFELFEAVFTGAGETLSAALTALLATGCDLAEAADEALTYLDQCLSAGFRPGMGNILPDRMFWAQPDNEDSRDAAPTTNEQEALEGFAMPPHETKH